MGDITIASDDRQFLSLVSEAAFANPFGERRAEIDRQILGRKRGGSSAEMVPAVVERVSQRVTALDRSGGRLAQVKDFSPDDQALMSNVFLFDIFHRYREVFDEAIAKQVAAAHQSTPVPFAKQAIGDLMERGFPRNRACHYFSVFYQVRRAYYFIDQGLVGQCLAMRRLREELWNTIFTHDIQWYEATLWQRMEDFSILLLGPTGAGKGAAAAAVGRSGYIPFNEKTSMFVPSFTESFVSVNLSQYAETLLESELFGHTKGAFTGAATHHEGLLSRCGKHGVIFLDEIGDISSAIQIKLLKVLEERVFCPVGSHEEKRFHGRVIAATHHRLDSQREIGGFRDDFYYRLCSDCITVPSLQERIAEDIGELDLMIANVVERIAGSANEDLCGRVREVIDEKLGDGYHWPGNVRELAQCVRRVIIKRDYQGETCRAMAGPGDELAEVLRVGGLTAEQLLARYCTLLYGRLGTYEEVARRVDLDRRTVKRYIDRT